jgi:hypothetical protein
MLRYLVQFVELFRRKDHPPVNHHARYLVVEFLVKAVEFLGKKSGVIDRLK